GYVSDLRYIFTLEGAKSVGSFGTIGSLFPSTWSAPAFWQLTAFISLMLAFMNFLPIPMLDGGYIFITLLELITRRRFPDSLIERVNTIGFYLVLGLMALGIFNDVVRFLF
ncbi:site-2 protease family protein, partial [Enterobacter hormaechei]